MKRHVFLQRLIHGKGVSDESNPEIRKILAGMKRARQLVEEIENSENSESSGELGRMFQRARERSPISLLGTSPEPNEALEELEECGTIFSSLEGAEVLGSGASGDAYLLDNGNVVKLQALDYADEGVDPVEAFNTEVKAMKKLRGATVTVGDSTWKIIPDLISDGTCKKNNRPYGYIEMNHLNKVKNPSREWFKKAEAVLDKAYDLDCVHVDTKLANFMNDEKGNPVLIDWGWSWCQSFGLVQRGTYPIYGRLEHEMFDNPVDPLLDTDNNFLALKDVQDRNFRFMKKQAGIS